MLTDTHCHISKKDYEDIDHIIENAKINGVVKMINNGTDYETNIEVLKLNEKYSNLYPALGFHCDAVAYTKDEDLKIIDNNINKIVAIGEIGLDYHYDDVDREAQKKLFEYQLSLAERYSKPVIIHSRDATKDTIDILKKFPKVRGSIHCFSGSIETARIYIKMGFKLGIGGVLTFKNSNLYKVIEEIDLKDIILETDSPCLAPEPLRGTQNEPANILYIAQKICEIKKISMSELESITEETVRSVFDI